jgi:hypothetical protein
VIGPYVRVGRKTLSGTLRTVYLDDPAARQAAYPQSQIHRERSRCDHVDGQPGAVVAEPHDRALAVLLLDLQQGVLEGGIPAHLVAAGVGYEVSPLPDLRHWCLPWSG